MAFKKMHTHYYVRFDNDVVLEQAFLPIQSLSHQAIVFDDGFSDKDANILVEYWNRQPGYQGRYSLKKPDLAD